MCGQLEPILQDQADALLTQELLMTSWQGLESKEAKAVRRWVSSKQEYLHYFLHYKSGTGLLHKTKHQNSINTEEYKAESKNIPSYSLNATFLPPS